MLRTGWVTFLLAASGMAAAPLHAQEGRPVALTVRDVGVGIGMGVGGTLRWLGISLGGIGAQRIEGVALAPAVGALDVRGLALAPAYFRIEQHGTVRGVNVSAFNHVKGTQRGLAIGIFNYARNLDGFQVGLLNYAANKPPGTRLLPILNYARNR